MATSGSTVIRVFLSSTFVDFQEERSLLVKQVFPSLRRRARSRGVDIVDVDLRWGVTAEQTERGETLPLCLAEIDRCRPYFISLLGERYGWVPPADPTYYKPALLERQPWLRERMGAASLTELEILHGVLRNPEMAGHAFFYLRDPAYAQAQSEPGWVADHPAEQHRLNALKEEVRRSGFPVCEGLATPQAIAERIEADLWAVIVREHPYGLDQFDAAERELRNHASYRQSRLGVYVGERYVEELEELIIGGAQGILITGESGSGKSSLIAKWISAHERKYPDHFIYTHHLGCSSDSTLLQPMLGRLINTASAQLLKAGVITESLAVPEDWCELVASVTETMQALGHWCQLQGRRWICVIDGLDRLASDDQKILPPWLPRLLPAGVQVVASAAACRTEEFLRRRGYRIIEIKSLEQNDQEQLIQLYLNWYAKKLEDSLNLQILGHNLAGSPLFLKVLLEELRQCGQHDTLKQQLGLYLSAERIDELYQQVLERLENDGDSEAVRKAISALWASRAGLSERELLAITDLKPMQWAPIFLALEEALIHNGSRLTFRHEYLRIAAQERYLPTDDQQRQAHGKIADWFRAQKELDEREAEELPWQLHKAGRLDDLRGYLLNPVHLACMNWHRRGSRDVINYWLAAKREGDGELDEIIVDEVEKKLEGCKIDIKTQIWIADQIADFLYKERMCGDPLLRLGNLSLELRKKLPKPDEESMVFGLYKLAAINTSSGRHEEARNFLLRALSLQQQLDPSSNFTAELEESLRLASHIIHVDELIESASAKRQPLQTVSHFRRIVNFLMKQMRYQPL